MTAPSSYYEIFQPLLHQFCEETHHLEMDGDFSTIFLPHVMSGYDKADKKIFYFGRDTNGWTATDDLLHYFEEQQLNSYIDETNHWIKKHGFLEYNKNRASGFWTLAMQLHLQLKGVTDTPSIGVSLEEKHRTLLNDFGYGNTNAIEVPDSLKNQGLWEALDKEKYWFIKEKSKIFDKLRFTITCFQPHLVFIFNWGCDDKLFLEGLNYQVQKYDDLVNGYFWVYTLADTHTKIIWTVHPNNLRYQGCATDELIEIILSHV